jgi:hypothetical protein
MEKRLLLILNSEIVGVVSIPIDQEMIMPDDYEGAYDTVVLDDDEFFDIGEYYSIEIHDERKTKTLSIEELRKKMKATRAQLHYALVIFGLRDDTDMLSNTKGSLHVKTYLTSAYTTLFERTCKEIKEIIQLLNVTEEQADDVFTLASSIDIDNLQGSLTSEQYNIIVDYKATEEAKNVKRFNIKKSTVNVNGKVFDADEDSMNRMMSALVANSFNNNTAIDWKLSNNSVETISYEELAEAHALAINKLGDILLGK